MRKGYYKTNWNLNQNGHCLQYDHSCENENEFHLQPQEIMLIITDINHYCSDSDRNDFGTWKHLCLEVLNKSYTHELIVPVNSKLSELIDHRLIIGTLMYISKNDLDDNYEDDICYNVS